jgi:hypothetical protein
MKGRTLGKKKKRKIRCGVFLDCVTRDRNPGVTVHVVLLVVEIQFITWTLRLQSGVRSVCNQSASEKVDRVVLRVSGNAKCRL